MMSIIKNNSFFTDAEKEYFDRQFVDLLEDHASYLAAHSSATTILVEPMDTYRFRADIYEFFRSRKISTKLWAAILVVNRIADPQDFSSKWNNKELIIPPQTEVERLRTNYKRK